MTIIESLVVEQEEGLFRELSRDLSLELMEGSAVPVLRMEVDPELVVYFYAVESLQSASPAVRDHVIPHMKRVVMIGHAGQLNKWVLPDFLREYLESYGDSLPQVLILCSEENEKRKIPEYLGVRGLYLGDYRRLLFWDRENPADVRRVWQGVWEKFPVIEKD